MSPEFPPEFPVRIPQNSLAFQVGLRQLWRERVLGHYLRREISRDEAIDAVGIDLVELAERQRKAMMEDLAWAMEN